jgi:CheY-like chemotaxis protein
MDRIDLLYVVDDDDVYQYLLKKEIAQTSKINRVNFYLDGEDAIISLEENAKVTNEIPELILLDINMPIMDGWDFLKAFRILKGDLSKQPVIYLVSSSSDERDVERARVLEEVTGYVIKPIRKNQLESIILHLKEAG